MDFEPRQERVEFLGETYIMREPPLGEALELADSYFELEMQGDTIRVKIKEEKYVRAVCQRYFEPPINVLQLPARVYPQLRDLINRWEDWSGMSALRTYVRRQAEAR